MLTRCRPQFSRTGTVRVFTLKFETQQLVQSQYRTVEYSSNDAVYIVEPTVGAPER